MEVKENRILEKYEDGSCLIKEIYFGGQSRLVNRKIKPIPKEEFEKLNEKKPAKPVKVIDNSFQKYKKMNKAEQVKLLEEKGIEDIPTFEKGRVELLMKLYEE